MMDAILKRIPCKERVYFGCCILTAVTILLVMPMSTPTLDELRETAITNNTRGFSAAELRDKALPLAQQPPQMGDTARLDDVKARIERRVRVTAPAETRDVFLRSSEQVYSLPLVTADTLPGIPDVPAYDVPVGEAPAVRLQRRFVPAGNSKVDLTDKNNDNPFEDR